MRLEHVKGGGGGEWAEQGEGGRAGRPASGLEDLGPQDIFEDAKVTMARKDQLGAWFGRQLQAWGRRKIAERNEWAVGFRAKWTSELPKSRGAAAWAKRVKAWMQ